MSLEDFTLTGLSKQLHQKKISSVELTQECLDRVEAQNPELNAFVSVNSEGALEMAKAADELLAKEEGNELTGIPLGIKDNFCELGVESTAASNVLKGFIPPYESTVLSRLRAGGAVFLGHTNTDEFTMGSSTETSAYGTSKNPHNPELSPGGSSGGSAAAVAAKMVPWALGTDTGGSIRQPASFCGVTGMKNTYGRVSRYGVMSMASSLDTIGSLAQTPQDAALILKHIAGHDPLDGTTSPAEVPDYQASLNESVEGMTVGIPQEYLEGLPQESKKAFDEAVKRAEGLGMKTKEVSLPMTEHGLAVYYIICPSEVSANMSRYDGLRFGPPSDAGDLVESYFEARSKGFGDEVKRRIILGTYALSAGYYDAYYKKALKVRTLIIREFEQVFADVDVLMTPTCPSTAFPIGSKASDPIQMYLEDVMTIPASVAGIPAISVPLSQVNDLPYGIQIIAPQLQEARVLQVGHQLIQQAA